MSDQIKQRLSKIIKNYNDKKKNLKYLIYFNETLDDDDLILSITDGTECWQSNKLDVDYLNKLKSNKLSSSSSFSKSATKLDDFLTIIDDSLRLGKFEVISDSDLSKVELKLLLNDYNASLSLDSSNSSKREIKNFLFSLYDKYNKLEIDYNKIKPSKNISNTNNKDVDNNSASQSPSNDMLKRFNLTNSNNNPANSRKQGYSVINPLNKRRKNDFYYWKIYLVYMLI
jgi:hypothetical protein